MRRARLYMNMYFWIYQYLAYHYRRFVYLHTDAESYLMAQQQLAGMKRGPAVDDSDSESESGSDADEADQGIRGAYRPPEADQGIRGAYRPPGAPNIPVTKVTRDTPASEDSEEESGSENSPAPPVPVSQQVTHNIMRSKCMLWSFSQYRY